MQIISSPHDVDRLIHHYLTQKIDKKEKNEAIKRIKLLAKNFHSLTPNSQKNLQRLKRALLKKEKSDSTSLAKVLRILAPIPLSIEEEFFVIDSPEDKQKAPKALPILGEQAKMAQANYFLQMTSRFLKDYIFPNKDEFDELWLQEFSENLEPLLLPLVLVLGFPTPSDLESGDKQAIKMLLKKLKLFLSHLCSCQSLNAEHLLETLNNERNMCGLPAFHESRSLFKKQIVWMIHEILAAHFKPEEPLQKIGFRYAANRLGKMLFKITKPAFLITIVTKLLEDNAVFILESSPIEQSKQEEISKKAARDSKFNSEVGHLLSGIIRDFIQFGNPYGGTKFAVSLIETAICYCKEWIGKTVQEKLGHILQSRSRLQLFHILSLIFWDQSEDNWKPYLNKKMNNSSSEEDIVKITALLNNRFSEILCIKTDENTSYIGKAAAGILNLEGSLPEFSRHLSQVLTTMILNQNLILYAVMYLMEGTLRHITKEKT